MCGVSAKAEKEPLGPRALNERVTLPNSAQRGRRELEERGTISFGTRNTEVESLAIALTEQRNPSSENLEKLTARNCRAFWSMKSNTFQDAFAQRGG